jgi:23S rRNA G2069 N7-methylase RlmK/C1962 C5-methylase RlmI
VVSVDLSAAYLEDLEANLAANALLFKPGYRHESVRGDGRRFLETRAQAERFDGIVLDPPTAAAAGRRFWSVRRDLEPMLKSCVQLLAPGGVLLVTQNQAGPPLGLERILERIATRAHRTLVRLEPASAGLDHPSRDGFPEGDPFEGVLIQVK